MRFSCARRPTHGFQQHCSSRRSRTITLSRYHCIRRTRCEQSSAGFVPARKDLGQTIDSRRKISVRPEGLASDQPPAEMSSQGVLLSVSNQRIMAVVRESHSADLRITSGGNLSPSLRDSRSAAKPASSEPATPTLHFFVFLERALPLHEKPSTSST